MCTEYTLHYNCGHTQSSLRCPRSALTHAAKNAASATQNRPCSDKYYLKGQLNDDCIECKLNRGMAPGQQTGFNAWAEEVKNGHADTLNTSRADCTKTPELRASIDAKEQKSRSTSVASVNPRLVFCDDSAPAPGTTEPPSMDEATLAQKQDDFEARLRASLALVQRAQSSSTADSGYASYTTAKDGEPERYVSPLANVGDGVYDGYGESGTPDGETSKTRAKGTPEQILERTQAPAKTGAEDVGDWMWGGMTGFGDEAA